MAVSHRIFILALVLTGLVVASKAQNLIVNPGFEQFSSQPIQQGQVSLSTKWEEVIRSADYMNTNYGGWSPQVGGSLKGTGYMGFASYGNSNGASEAIGQWLGTNAIEKGKSYIAKINAKSSSGGFYSDICGGVGIYGFSTRPTLGTTSTHPEDLGGVLLWKTDTVTSTNWNEFEGCFTAETDASYIVFAVEKVICPQYIYVDDLSIELFSTGFDLGKDTSLCTGDTLILDAGGAGATDYEWSDGSSLPTLEVTESGLYSVKRNLGGCKESDLIHVSFSQFPTMPLGPDTFLCEKGNLLLDATVPDATYQWQNGSTSSTFQVQESGVYWVEIDVNGCSTKDTIEVGFLTTELNLGRDSTMCPDETLVLDAENKKSAYVWQDGSKSSTFMATPPGLYWVEVANVCDTLLDSIKLDVIEPRTLNIGRDTAVCSDSFLTINLQPVGLGYEWWNEHTDSFQKISPPQVVWASIDDVCETVYDTLVLGEIDCDCRVYFANAFTPNADTINQVFRPKSHCGFQEYRFQIFNRWGERILETDEPFKGWDGTFRGESSPVGVYVYIFTYRQDDKVYKMKKGNVTLVR